MSKTDFIGLGVQKCASSWLYSVLAEHPDVVVTQPKELNFFSSYYNRGKNWYESFFLSQRRDKSIAGEISPSYFPDFDAPKRAFSYNPNFKIIVALRDPVERAYSNHLHEIRLGQFKGDDLSFESGLENNPMYVEQSLYAKHLAHWFSIFPKDQFFIVFQEEIKQSPKQFEIKLYEFLGIETTFQSTQMETIVNQSYLPRSRIIENFMAHSGHALRKIGLGSIIKLAHKSGAMDWLYKQLRKDIRAVVPPMQESTRFQLNELFSKDLEKLAELLDRDVFPWKTWESTVNK